MFLLLNCLEELILQIGKDGDQTRPGNNPLLGARRRYFTLRERCMTAKQQRYHRERQVLRETHTDDKIISMDPQEIHSVVLACAARRRPPEFRVKLELS